MKLKKIVSICGLIIFLLWSSTSMAQTQIGEGKGFFEFSEYEPMKDKKIRVFYYKPEGDVTDMPVLFVMHGVLRDADVYRDNWVSLADKYKVLVIVPEFSKEDFPGVRSYNYGNLRTKDGNAVDERYWSYSLIDPIFESVVKQTGSKATYYDLFGHSAGSQFAHRFFLFKGDTKANRVIAANAGSYMMPRTDIKFPFGLKGTRINKERLREGFSKKLIVQLGEKDTDPNAPYLPKETEAKKQGDHRFERGQYFFKTAREIAQKEGMEFNWIIRTVPGVAHSNSRMAIDAAEFLYGN